MLKQLRKKGVAKKILWVVAVIIIISFGFFGTANYLNNEGGITDAGKVFGRTITFDEFEKSLRHAQHQAILRYGENFYKVSPYLDLDSQAWDRIILLEEARKRRIKILDQEVVDTIEDFEFFKNNGVFEPAVYQKIVRYIFRAEPREFEEGIRESLIFAKIFEAETAPVTLTDAEVLEAFTKKNEQTQVSFVLLLADDYKKDVALAPEDMQAYFEGHKEEFRLPPTINLQYISLEYPPETTTPAQSETEKDADSNVPEPTEKTQAKPDLSPQANAIYEDLKTNPDFEAIAKKHNLPVQESGFFSMEQPNLKIGWSYELLQKAFDLAVDQLSEPIATSKGYYILKMKEKKDSYVPSFDEAKEKVKEILTAQKTRDLAKQKADEAAKAMSEAFASQPSGNFSDIAKNLNLKVSQTPLFARGQYLPGVGLSKEFQETAFSLSDENKVSQPIEIAKGFCILHRDSYVAIDKEKFEKEKDALYKTLAEEKKNEVFNSFLARLKSNAKLVDNIAKIRKQQAPAVP